eukprot:tig00020850_g14673.t1
MEAVRPGGVATATRTLSGSTAPTLPTPQYGTVRGLPEASAAAAAEPQPTPGPSSAVASAFATLTNSLANLASKPEMKLANDPKERDRYELMADLYSLLRTLELLEKAYTRDAIAQKDYAPACQKMISQYRASQQAFQQVAPDLQRFAHEYGLQVPSALHRLRAGVPATIEHAATAPAEDSAQHIATTTQCFITAMDALKLGYNAVDQLFPILSDLMASMHQIARLKPDFEGKAKVRHWIQELNAMRAHETLAPEQARQMEFDLQNSYNAFMAALK